MKVTFFGSSHGFPEPHRCCSSLMLETAHNKYLIDVGTDVTEPLVRRGLSPESITAVFLTHMHGDHVNGLVPFVDLCSWCYRTADAGIFTPDMKLVSVLSDWMQLCGHGMTDKLSFHPVTEGLIYEDDDIRVTALETGHMPHAFAYRVEAEGKKLLFTGDLKHSDGPTADYARFATEDGLDLVVAECAHFDAMNYLEPLRAHPPKLFCFNHYSWARTEGCYRLKSVLKDEIPVMLATDDMEIVL